MHMAESNEHLVDLLKQLTRHNVRYIIGGGVAAVLHGVERLTVDLDIALDRSNDNIHAFLEVMQREKMIPRAPVPADSLYDEKLLQQFVEEKEAVVFTFHDPDHPFRQIDIFLTGELSYSQLIPFAEDISIDDAVFLKVLSIRKLLEMKEAMSHKREKDRLDITMLKKLMERR